MMRRAGRSTSLSRHEGRSSANNPALTSRDTAFRAPRSRQRQSTKLAQPQEARQVDSIWAKCKPSIELTWTPRERNLTCGETHGNCSANELVSANIKERARRVERHIHVITAGQRYLRVCLKQADFTARGQFQCYPAPNRSRRFINKISKIMRTVVSNSCLDAPRWRCNLARRSTPGARTKRMSLQSEAQLGRTSRHRGLHNPLRTLELFSPADYASSWSRKIPS